MQKAQLELILLWHRIQKKDHPKGNAGKVTKWMQLVDKDPPPFVEWKDEEEDRLLNLKSNNIDIEDTVLGRANKTVQRKMEVQFGLMTAEAQLKFLQRLKEHKKTTIMTKLTNLARIIIFDKFVTYTLRIIELDVKHIRQQDVVI